MTQTVSVNRASWGLTISTRPVAVLTLQPNWTQIFRGVTLTLRCAMKGKVVNDWKYIWYKKGISVYLNTKSKYTIRPANKSHTGSYTCGIGGRASQWRREPTWQDSKALPKASVSVSPHGLLYSGETVTLQCDISEYTDWTYRWYQNNQPLPTQTSKTVRYIIPIIKTGQTGLYRCEGMRTERPQRSQPSNDLSINQKDILTGDSVTLTCTESSGWRFYWYRHRQDSEPVATTSGSSYTLSQVSVSDGGQYRCRAGRGDPVYYTQYSEPVHIQVTGRPAAVLTFQPNWPQIFMGESVTMICNIQEGDVTDWTYAWHKTYDDGSNTDFMNTEKHQINATDLSVSGDYRCLGRNRHNQHDSTWSNRVRLTSSVSVRISPNRNQHFTSKSLSLICDLKGNSTGWRLMRYTETGVESGCSPHWGSITGSTCTITSTDTGDSGVYWCESGSGQYSNAVNITVSDGDVILESPAHLVTEGDSLTLRCKCRNQRCTNSKVDFYKDGVLIRNETTGEMTISAVMKSDEGFYKCKSDQIESPESWVTVRVVGPVVAAVLLTIILVLLCRHNIRKGEPFTFAIFMRQLFKTEMSCMLQCSMFIVKLRGKYN
uniref:Ig-like domain-containing protein n=1 Tax=Esox lucius TaxID=8010 RepID=A0A6Q2XSC3_ESOLU